MTYNTAVQMGKKILSFPTLKHFYMYCSVRFLGFFAIPTCLGLRISTKLLTCKWEKKFGSFIYCSVSFPVIVSVTMPILSFVGLLGVTKH